MICIVGLGNPGEKYQNNRHNVGQMFVDYLFSEFTSLRVGEFKLDKYSNSKLSKLVINNKQIVLAKPMTFMNKSGEAVSKLILNFKFQISNLVVVHDDLDIPLGKFKIQKGTGPQLHNGIESIENHLKTKDFWRIRIGVDNRGTTSPERAKRVEGETYVLENFTDEETKIIHLLFPEIYKRLQTFVVE